jgi:hypothetical protein
LLNNTFDEVDITKIWGNNFKILSIIINGISRADFVNNTFDEVNITKIGGNNFTILSIIMKGTNFL